MGNVVVPVTLLAGGTIVVWYGIANPSGGLFAGLGGLLHGKPAPSVSSGFTATAADLASLQGVAGGAAGTAPAAQVSGGRAQVLAAAHTWLGTPYSFGGITRAGVDCSALTMFCFQAAGIHLPRTSELQALVGRRTRNPQPGDLVCFGVPCTHVGIYVGGGQMIDANSASVGAVTQEGVNYGAHPIVYRDLIDTPLQAAKTKFRAPLAVRRSATPPGRRPTPHPRRPRHVVST